jgi:hypothetical protein
VKWRTRLQGFHVAGGGPTFRGFRGCPGTYGFHDSPSAPIERELDDELRWLRAEAVVPESLAADSHAPPPIRPATAEELSVLVGSRTAVLPASFRAFVAHDEPRRRVRSCTACYLDLGDYVVPTSNGEGWLIHFLSDQQWVMHWLLYFDGHGHEAVIATEVPFGFETDENPPGTFDGAAVGAAVCAESFSEFLYRFWIENEIWFALDKPARRPLTTEQARYAEHYRSQEAAD